MHVKRYLNDDYVLLNDCTLPDDRGGTTQIDHILISPYGVFVIETKNYKGWIFGSAHQKKWTQQIYKKDLNFKIRYIKISNMKKFYGVFCRTYSSLS